jgi:hypothetical protein
LGVLQLEVQEEGQEEGRKERCDCPMDIMEHIFQELILAAKTFHLFLFLILKELILMNSNETI